MLAPVNQTVLVTGGFDPIHSGHIRYFKAARLLGSRLVVGINSDAWLKRKKGKPFMSWEERSEIILALECVDEVLSFNDEDGTSCDAVRTVLDNTTGRVIFANGGDRTEQNIPEMSIVDPRLHFQFGVGGDNKQNSSSWLLDEWKTQKTERDWGYWRVLDDKGTVKVKELVINPGCSLSDQRHMHRKEHWYILEGACCIDIEYDDVIQTEAGRDGVVRLKQHDTTIIKKYDWHRAYNPFDQPCHILEVQYGERCVEEDIERRNTTRP